MAATTKVRVSINGTVEDYRIPAGSTPSSLASNAQFREEFSLPANITVLVNGHESTARIPAGAVLTIQVNAARKAAATRKRVTVQYNGTSETYRVPAGVVYASSLASNAQFREDFNLPANITVLVNGVESSAALADGDVLSIRLNASRKA